MSDIKSVCSNPECSSVSKPPPLYTYRFNITYKDNHTVYGGHTYIKAPNMEEAKYLFKQHRYDLKEIQREPMTLHPLGKDCSFTVEIAE